jgi:hypothetical protein
MSINASLRATHLTGNLTTAPQKFSTRRGRGFRIRVKNEGANQMDISFDGGRTFYPIASGAEFAEDVAFHFFWARGNGGGTSFTALLFEG